MGEMRFSASGGWWGNDWYDRVKLADKYGFDGIEQLSWIGLDLERAKKVLDYTGIVSTAVIMESADSDVMRLISNSHGMVWEDSREAFVTAFRETVRGAKALGVPNIIATVGNERADVSRDEQFECCVKTLRLLSDIAEDEGITIVVEPLNVKVDHRGYFLVTTADTVKLLGEVGSDFCKMLFDIYHQQISEGDVIRSIRENIGMIGHFHIADNPGRMQPGSGELNYKSILRAIQETGYDRWLAFECGSSLRVGDLVREMHVLIDEFR